MRGGHAGQGAGKLESCRSRGARRLRGAAHLDRRDLRVLQDSYHRGDGEAVEQAIAGDRFPVELEHKRREERGAADDAAQVEDGRACAR